MARRLVTGELWEEIESLLPEESLSVDSEESHRLLRDFSIRRGRACMTIVALRVFIFAVLPVLAAGIHIGLDRSCRSRQRKLEIFLLYLFGIGVAGSGIGNFFGHVFLSDTVARSIGWPEGDPFQLEVGFSRTSR